MGAMLCYAALMSSSPSAHNPHPHHTPAAVPSDETADEQMAIVAEGLAGEPLSDRELRVSDLRSRPPRRRMIPILLFVATCLSTFYVGAMDWDPLRYVGYWSRMRQEMGANWFQGLTYMGAVLAILLTHEMGHFLTTLRYHIPSTYPIFIPVPFNAIGTMGAVIGLDGLKANRKEMFDLGLSGPLAGLVVAIPVLWIGIDQLDLNGPAGSIKFHNPLIGRLMMGYLHGEQLADKPIGILQLNPWFMAGWVGMLITGLNMLPISQLDGGHVTYTLFGRRAHIVARGFLLAAIAYVVITEAYVWSLMLVLVTFIGTDHPPTSNDGVPLGLARRWVGYASLAIPILCFAPRPFVFS